MDGVSDLRDQMSFLGLRLQVAFKGLTILIQRFKQAVLYHHGGRDREA